MLLRSRFLIIPRTPPFPLPRFIIPSPISFNRFSSSSADNTNNNSLAGPSLIPGRSPPRPQLDSLCGYLKELALRSASAREAIREAVRAPSIEIGLRHFHDFLSLYEFKQTEILRLVESHDIDRMRIMLELFKTWYMTMKAPQIVNMKEPWTWFSKARMMRRRFIFHAGPTNSGKTHAALEKLMSAKSGVYCAPLKALASQVWMKVNERVSCDLLIGDERQFAGSAEHVSCTVEMTPIELGVDVAVIDEIQLIEDPERGWAWTRALLGLPAREIHLCGEPRALNLVKKLLWHTKEAGRLQVMHHDRLVPLDVENQSLRGRLDNAKAGDCFVCFSRKQVFETAKNLKERLAHKNAKVHVVYGGLPFAVRQYESEAFNNGTENGDFHVLVSTDAIAYGLNLSIRRIIFSTMRKFDGNSMNQLSPSSILQIAGRAGRFGRKFSDHGYATTLHDREHHLLQSTMEQGAQALRPSNRAGILPTADVLSIFAETVPHLAFDEMIKEFNENCTVNETFFVCNMARSLIAIAETISDVTMPHSEKGIVDKILFCFAPMGSGDQEGLKFLRRLCSEHGAGGPVKLQIDKEVEEQLVVKADRLLGSESLKGIENTNKKGDPNQHETEEDDLLFSVMHEEEKLLSSKYDCSDADFVTIIEAFYKKYNPSKTSDVVSLCQKYPDRSKIMTGLKAKYNVSSVVIDQEDLIRLIRNNRTNNKHNPKQYITLDHSQQIELQLVLRRCETLYRWVEVYGWLAWRFPRTFSDLELSAKTKMTLVKTIDRLLKAQVQNE